MSVAANDEWRLRALERRLDTIESSHPEVLAERLTHVAKHLGELDADVKSLRRALYTFALSFATGAIILGVTLSQILGVR